jgi:glyoxylase I family protein
MKPADNQSIKGAGFHHVSLGVVDFDRAVAFYKEGLGFQEKLSCTLEGRRMLMLDLGDGSILEIFSEGKKEAPSEGRITHFCIRTADCDAAHALALAAGAVETLSPRDVTLPDPARPVDVRISFVLTPSGESLEFLQSELI